jgi:hypothetical protein
VVLRLRSQERTPSFPAPPAASRFDPWQTEDIYAALEAQLMEAQGAMDEYRRVSSLDDKAKVAGILQIKMDTAMEALGALRRRLQTINESSSLQP